MSYYKIIYDFYVNDTLISIPNSSKHNTTLIPIYDTETNELQPVGNLVNSGILSESVRGIGSNNHCVQFMYFTCIH